MADNTPNPTTDSAAQVKQLTAAEAAKRVKRVVATDKDGNLIKAAVKADEVLAFRDCGTHVVVVTTDGQKLSSAAA